MLLNLAAERRVLFVGGKGGVGKTVVASALALGQARAGRHVLVVSTDPAHNLGHLWGRAVGDRRTQLAQAPGGRLDGLEIDPGRTTEEHLAAVRTTMRRFMPEHLAGEVDRHLQLARDAPGTHEAAILERIAETLETGLEEYDLVVFDTAPSGHTARLMALPETMSAWTDGLLRRQQRSSRFGAAMRRLDPDDGAAELLGGRRRTRHDGTGGTDDPGGPDDKAGAPPGKADRDAELRRILERRRARFVRMREVMLDGDRTSFVIVLVAERVPVLETVELHGQLARTGVDVGALVVNRRSPTGAGELLAERHRLEATHLAHVRRELPGVPVVELPLLAGDVLGEPGVARLAAEVGGTAHDARQ
ncbi:TRC40/GET3/ArsA family transport-energizing ATPase [Georgenia halophila]|uniref:TRC40/GET3/ArsA family transport-energizing ATPase n=1 Tax=Georgenia halophila TaxID=620889 RepID=A0ABP8LP17_9MICO